MDKFKFTIDLLQETIKRQEDIVASFNNYVEAIGHDINLKIEGQHLSKKISGMSHAEMLRQIQELQENPEDLTQDSKQTFAKAEQLIESPFSFYSTDLRLNED